MGTLEMENSNEGLDSVAMTVKLRVTEPEVLVELSNYEEGPEREHFALNALRVGVLAIQQAGGVLDAATLRNEGERILGELERQIRQRTDQISSTLKHYFDPMHGDFPRRLKQLLEQDGELESFLKKHLKGDSSTLAQTLLNHVGEGSPLLQKLSPERNDGILAALQKVVEEALKVQRERILSEFTLDREDSALARLLSELTDSNGELRDDLKEDFECIKSEFSLDNDDSALSRLVSRVERAQRIISDEFSTENEDSALSRLSKLLESTHETVEAKLTLDDEDSPLSRLRREMLKVIDELRKSNTDFQGEVRSILESLQARKEESRRSVRHGVNFEEEAGAFLQREAQRLEDIYEATGNTTGRIARSKVGDHVITLGPDSAAPQGRIVIETKQSKSYSLAKALAEISEARDNRKAEVGLFIFSRTAAPEGVQPLARYGQDVVVVWDSEDPDTDFLLKAAISLCRAMVIRSAAEDKASEMGLTEIEEAILRITKDAEGLSEISSWASTVERNGKKIRDKAERLQADLEQQVSRLEDSLSSLKSSL
ncbi:MAG TPA: hypothetical protein VKZ59_02390 [Acidobacteriota bacterium]|nr:hypothetical protein [Acidobacteriota bacterium]